MVNILWGAHTSLILEEKVEVARKRKELYLAGKVRNTLDIGRSEPLSWHHRRISLMQVALRSCNTLCTN
ncbi:hypothetical protein Leryth_016504 [Lithospermum erythrorhizon]|nr:hypothetical protein Leryth_016504 [Lithospermum erythrorhizon]